jgi:hypothetical protein
VNICIQVGLVLSGVCDIGYWQGKAISELCYKRMLESEVTVSRTSSVDVVLFVTGSSQ